MLKYWLLTAEKTKPALEKCEKVDRLVRHDLNSVDYVVKLLLNSTEFSITTYIVGTHLKFIDGAISKESCKKL